MAVRLSKIAREFNVGLSTIVEFLHSKGIKISSDPNAKLTDEDYALVAKEFSSDSQVKKESSLVDLKNTRKKKETVTIDNAGNISSGNENTEEEEEEFISIKDEVRFENKIKIVDHIDLNPEKKTQPEPVEATPCSGVFCEHEDDHANPCISRFRQERAAPRYSGRFSRQTGFPLA